MRKNRGWASVLFLLISFAAGVAQSQQQAQGSHEIHQLFVEDQKDREVIGNSAQTPSWQDWEKIATRDKQRQERARELMAARALNSGEDYRDAAFIFQHGQTPNDYLLAHILAVVGIAKGDQESRWIAAATLDRYLQSIKQPQVFGTQYFKADKATPYSQESFDRNLLGDVLRQAFLRAAN